MEINTKINSSLITQTTYKLPLALTRSSFDGPSTSKDWLHALYSLYPHSLELHKENTIDTNTWFHEPILILNQKSLNLS